MSLQVNHKQGKPSAGYQPVTTALRPFIGEWTRGTDNRFSSLEHVGVDVG